MREDRAVFSGPQSFIGASIGRRALIAGAAAWPLAAAAAADAIAAIERRRGGRLGVYAIDTGTGRILAHRADERFALCSTFKGVLAGMVLSRIDARQDAPGNLVRYGRHDLVAHSPVTGAHAGAGALTVEALLAAILLVSDNTAANLLLARVGGPPALTAYARALGDPVTRFDRYEGAAGGRTGTLDTTTPRAIATTARRLMLGDALSAGSRARLDGWMAACRSGMARLRAGLPRNWIVADRTGTDDGACNDYAVARRPGRAPLVMAAYHDAPGMALDAQEGVLREAAAAVADWAG